MTRAKPKLLVTRRLPEAVETRLERDYLAVLNKDDHSHTAATIIAAGAGMDGLLVTPADRVDGGTIGRLPDSVRIIATFSVGYEHIDVDAAKSRGMAVTNTPEVLTDATADVAMLLLLGASRRAQEGTAMLRAGRWTGWRPTQLMGIQTTGKRLGIVGMGRIGRAVAGRARAFGMEIHYCDARRLEPRLEMGATFHARAEEMLPLCHFLSLHCPLTPETAKFLDARRIALLPDGAVVVNSARGGVVDDGALIAALKSGKLAAAGLDVFDGEPDLDPGYLEVDNAFLLPHLGSATIETRDAMGFKALDNLDAFFAGREPPDRVA